jgi:hypothetical protein
VHPFPSSQAAELFVNVHPPGATQASFVQALPSLQVAGGPPTQIPFEQASFAVHALPSLQEPSLGSFAQSPN